MDPTKFLRQAVNVILMPVMWLGDAARFLGGYAKRSHRPVDEVQRQIGLQWLEIMQEATEDEPVIFEISVKMIRKGK